MGTPKGNGLVEITGENKAMDKVGSDCIKWLISEDYFNKENLKQ